MNNTSHQVPFKTKVAHCAKEIQKRDCARAKHLVAGHHPHGPNACHDKKKGNHTAGSPPSSGTTIPCADNGVTYLAAVAIGSPAKNYNLLIDTGSSNTWVKQPPYTPTSTSQDTRKPFQIQYGSGSCSGNEYTDQVALCPQLCIKNQSIGVADKCDQMDGIDGILGIGPVDLTQGTTAPGASGQNNDIPTITDNLVAQGLIKNERVCVYYEPTTSADAANGCLCFGEPDPSQYNDDLNYVPITKTSPACNYWGIDQSISYGSEEIMASCAGISDTGTTLIMLPSTAFQAYQKKTGAVMDSQTQLLTVTQDQYDKMESMFFSIGGVKYELTKNAQIWPRSMNSTLGAKNDQICLVFADMGGMANDGLCFINGFAFLQRFYSVYDTTNSQVGYATTKYTTATTN
ncbi:acid protease [Mycena maculata]|uniref:Acid protease n=1 Tax=Mycena maculata TaxID=230809 RepID=A0AAD7J911_9AGAR|nr:acid protease [Mycena maculata]KAJ7758102.1 acid protease [Mycena maculata]